MSCTTMQSSSDSSNDIGKKEAVALITEGENLIQKLVELKHSLQGESILRRRISAEIKVLKNNLEENSSWLKQENIASSNLHQLGAIVDVTNALGSKADGVFQKFKDGETQFIMDIVAYRGRAWIKVICRCPDSIQLSFVSGNKDSSKSVLDQAKMFLRTAEFNQIFYTSPQVFLIFCKGISKSLSEAIGELGCNVVTHCTIPDDELPANAFASSSNNQCEIYPQVVSSKVVKKRYQKLSNKSLDALVSDIMSNFEDKKALDGSSECELLYGKDGDVISVQSYNCVTLDVTAMVAYTSNTSNGNANYIFKDKFLSEQAEWERENSVKKVIENYWKDVKVLVCEEAYKRYMAIVDTLAGEQEKKRAQELVKKIEIVPNENPLEEVLTSSYNITDSNKLIFGTSVHHKAPIITANSRFIRGAAAQGYKIAAFLHSPRALTEEKESDAQTVES